MSRARKADADGDVREFLEQFPESARPLLEAKGANVVERLGLDVVKDVLLDVLCGVNLRQSTEMLTRRRVAFLNAATVVMFLKAQRSIPDFTIRLHRLAAEGLQKSLSREQRWLLQWVLGLNDKAMQNVLRDDTSGIDQYTERFAEVMAETAQLSADTFGELSGELNIAGDEAALSWPFVLAMLQTIGAQTLAIRGSEKSMYGKLFERIVLASLLQLLGFELIDEPSGGTPENVFWLTSRNEKRESDATLLGGVGRGLRFDIGFIGRGNSEITLDKVSRFEREFELGGKKWYIGTFIIVDRIGGRSKLIELAERIDGTVFQMSLSFWPRDVARKLSEVLPGYDHDIIRVTDSDMRSYLKAALEDVPLHKALSLVEDVLTKEADDAADDEDE